MQLPFFYINEYNIAQKSIVLNEETSKHVVQVLRMKVGENLQLTDGKGNLLTCSIADDNKKHCSVEIEATNYQQPPTRKISIAISLIKNVNRFEWFLEKATEIGVSEIVPLICDRTEKEKFRNDRMMGICISAMLQSQQVWLPVLQEPTHIKAVILKNGEQQKFIAHCTESIKQSLSNVPISRFSNSQILIGPEGDFTPAEIELALENNCIPVSLGPTRLRTETAGIVAATLLCQV